MDKFASFAKLAKQMPTNLSKLKVPTNLSKLKIPTNLSKLQSNEGNSDPSSPDKPANKPPSPEIITVVKAANAAVNNSNASAKQVATLLQNRAVITAAQNLVNKIKPIPVPSSPSPSAPPSTPSAPPSAPPAPPSAPPAPPSAPPPPAPSSPNGASEPEPSAPYVPTQRESYTYNRNHRKSRKSNRKAKGKKSRSRR